MTIDQLPTIPDASGDVFKPVEKNGADFKVKEPFFCLDVSGNVAVNFTATNGSRFLLFTSSGDDNAKALYIFNVSVAGVVSYAAVKAGSNITITTSTRAFSVTSANNGSIGFIVFSGSVTRA